MFQILPTALEINKTALMQTNAAQSKFLRAVQVLISVIYVIGAVDVFSVSISIYGIILLECLV